MCACVKFWGLLLYSNMCVYECVCVFACVMKRIHR